MSTWYEKGAFYHMYPLGMTGAPKQNTDASVTNRFPELMNWASHIHNLGCNAIYIGPLFESSSHGYDTRDYRLVDRRLGDNDGFRRFVAHCHELDIRVVVDGVFNHTGREFFAFQDLQAHRETSRFRDWYKGLNFGWGSALGDSFSYESWQGHLELPCLNLWNPDVKRYLFDTVQFWIDEFDIDGIRLDCANVLDFTFMQELRSETSRMKPDFWLMGEVIHGDYSRWISDGMLHSVTNYELHKSLYSGLNDYNFFEIAHNVRRLEAIASRLYTFLDNHDENRIASKLTNPAHLSLAYMLLFTLPGIPSVYYGGEWGVTGLRSRDSDDALRPCIPISEAEDRHTSLTDEIKALAHIHTSNDAFFGGRYQELLLTNRQYAFARHGSDSVIITAVNSDFAAAEIFVPVPVPAVSAVNLMDGSRLIPADGKLQIKLEGNSGVVLQIKGE